jgi:hypothetical protein
LGTDVSLKDPERLVSSFASQLSFGQDNDGKPSCFNDRPHNEGNELEHLGSIFRQLGKEMIELGLLVARVCDAAIGGASLENAILRASTAKGRLIHYHSLAEKQALQRAKMGKQKRMQGSMQSQQKRMQGSMQSQQRRTPGLKESHPLPSCRDSDEEELWQQWHFDYGIFTILTSAMFLRSSQTGASSHSCPHIGLKVLNTSNRKVEYVCAPEDCLLVQVGEAAEILTGGKLRAVAHCVCRPLERGDDDDVSRETFVVFLQPSWDTCLVSPSPSEHDSMVKRLEADAMEEEGVFSAIQRQVPSLESRWRNGCTFAEFSRETTKQYYGTNGAQAKK